MIDTLRRRLITRWMDAKKHRPCRMIGPRVAARRLSQVKRKIRNDRLGSPLPSLLSVFPRIEVTKDAHLLEDAAAARAEVRDDLRRDFKPLKSRMRGLAFHTVFVNDDGLSVTVWPRKIGRKVVGFEGGAEVWERRRRKNKGAAA